MTTPLDDVRAKLGDRYTIERELGRGGMGAVYLAREIRLDRQVALKVLPAEFGGDASLRERFIRETRTAASFSHPNIVPVHSIEEREGVLAFAMGYVEGESLAERVKRSGPLDLRGVVRVLQDVGYALAYAHGRGVVHRDIKPDNIMIERATGRALLMDFGISRTIAAPAGGAAGLTRVGEVVGTPEYMSPEQAAAEPLDGRTDIYSLGLAALFAISGTKPIGGTSAQQILAKQLTEMPTPAATLRPDLPAKLCAAIDKCVQKNRDDRFTNAEALVDAIDAAQLGTPEVPLPIRMFAQELEMLGLMVFFFVVFGWLITRALSGEGNIDLSLPIFVMFAAASTRFIEAYFTSVRLMTLGFTTDQVHAGLTQVMTEREGHRKQLRADPETRRRRRSTVKRAIVQLGVAALLVYLGMLRRVEYAPHRYRVGYLGVSLAITGVCLFGVSMILLLRSPFRMNMTERMFRAVCLGPIGRWFLRRAAKAAAKRKSPAAA